MQITVPGTSLGAQSRLQAKVLVVDDEDLVQKLITYKLTGIGYEVIAASNGEEALELVTAARPDIVVMDVLMPVMSGLEALAAMKNDPATAAIPVILLTGRSADSAVAEGMQLGADDYIAKPFSPHELAARVKSLLQRVKR